jgi:hypothetical protein
MFAHQFGRVIVDTEIWYSLGKKITLKFSRRTSEDDLQTFRRDEFFSGEIILTTKAEKKWQINT